MTAQETAPTAPDQATATEMFWVACVQPAQQKAGVVALFTFKGTFVPLPSDTRRDAFNGIRAYIAEELTKAGQPADHNVLFFSLEPNQL